MKWYDNRGITIVGSCLEGCNQVSSVSSRVKGKSAKILVPCSSIIKEYNNGMSGFDFLDQKMAATIWIENHLVDVITSDYSLT